MSAKIFEFLKAGGDSGTRLSMPPTAFELMAETAQRAARRGMMRRAIARAGANKNTVAKFVGQGELARLPEDRRAAVKADLESEEAMLKLLEALGTELDEIARKEAEEAAAVREVSGGDA